MADTSADRFRELTISELQNMRQRQPCGTYEQAATWLGDWCLCGWDKRIHDYARLRVWAKNTVQIMRSAPKPKLGQIDWPRLADEADTLLEETDQP